MLYHWAISPTCEQSPNHMSKSCKMPPHRIIFHSYTRPLWISRPQCQQRRSWDHCMEAIKLAMATAKPLGSILGCWLFSVQKRDVFLTSSYEICNFFPIRQSQAPDHLKNWARPGFEPGTSRTRSANHTPRPTSHFKSYNRKNLWLLYTLI